MEVYSSRAGQDHDVALRVPRAVEHGHAPREDGQLLVLHLRNGPFELPQHISACGDA